MVLLVCNKRNLLTTKRKLRENWQKCSLMRPLPYGRYWIRHGNFFYSCNKHHCIYIFKFVCQDLIAGLWTYLGRSSIDFSQTFLINWYRCSSEDWTSRIRSLWDKNSSATKQPNACMSRWIFSRSQLVPGDFVCDNVNMTENIVRKMHWEQFKHQKSFVE